MNFYFCSTFYSTADFLDWILLSRFLATGFEKVGILGWGAGLISFFFAISFFKLKNPFISDDVPTVFYDYFYFIAIGSGGTLYNNTGIG